MMFLAVIFAAALFHTVQGEVDCAHLPNGNYEIGCKAYVHCQNGVLTNIECPLGMVYNNLTHMCDLVTNVLPPCGLVRDCKPPVQDGVYADRHLNCSSYYTCAHHIYYGHNFCTPGTVFDDFLKTCVWPSDAPPPCGTKH